jgi:hypothetical protein
VSKPVDIERTCCECGDSFVVTPGEQQYFQNLHLDLPARCLACRRLRQQLRLHGRDIVMHTERRES